MSTRASQALLHFSPIRIYTFVHKFSRAKVFFSCLSPLPILRGDDISIDTITSSRPPPHVDPWSPDTRHVRLWFAIEISAIMGPSFYAVPYPSVPKDRRDSQSIATEYQKHVYLAAKNNRLELTGYRWAIYLYGGEVDFGCKFASRHHFKDFLNEHPARTEEFCVALAQEGYPATKMRDVHYNIFIPQNLCGPDLVGFPITEQKAREYLSQYPIPSWIDRSHHAYAGWDLCPDTYGGSSDDSVVIAEASYDDETFRPSVKSTVAPRAFSGPAAISHVRKSSRAHHNIGSANSRRHSAGVSGVNQFVLGGNADKGSRNQSRTT